MSQLILQCQNCVHFRGQRGGQCRAKKHTWNAAQGWWEFNAVAREQAACDSIQVADKDEVFIQVFEVDHESSQDIGRIVYEVIAEYTIFAHKGWGDREAASLVRERHGADARFDWSVVESGFEF